MKRIFREYGDELMKQVLIAMSAIVLVSQITACGKEGDVGPFGNTVGPKKPGWMQESEKRKQQEMQAKEAQQVQDAKPE